MSYNDIITLKFIVPFNKSGICKFIKDSANLPNKVYSCLVKNNFVNNTKKDWIVNINVINVSNYNTIDINTCLDNIVEKLQEDLANNSTAPYLYYMQPPIEVIDKAFYPLICKLATKKLTYWPMYELDDLIQMCRLALLELYNKGYYIHKTLLDKAFTNKIYYEMRSRKKESCLVSLTQYETDNFDDSYIECFEDKKAIYESEKEEERFVIENIFEELKPVFIRLFGERRFSMLLRDIANKAVTQTDQSMLRRIRRELTKLGKDTEWFRGKLRGDL